MRLVDADALVKEAGKLWSEMPDGEELSKELMKAISHAPTVDAVPVKHGRWAKNKYGYITCSICDSFPLAVMTGSLITMNLHYELYESEYCPYCGAKMDLEDKQ